MYALSVLCTLIYRYVIVFYVSSNTFACSCIQEKFSYVDSASENSWVLVLTGVAFQSGCEEKWACDQHMVWHQIIYG